MDYRLLGLCSLDLDSLDYAAPWTIALCPWSFSRQQYWSELPFPSPGDLPGPGIEPISPALAGRFFTIESPGKPNYHFTVLLIVTLEITRVYLKLVCLPFPNKARTLDYLNSTYSFVLFCYIFYCYTYVKSLKTVLLCQNNNICIFFFPMLLSPLHYSASIWDHFCIASRALLNISLSEDLLGNNC